MYEFSPVSSNKLYIQIYDQIHNAIVSGKYSVGDKLPSEKELCQQFNVSRVPVREALCVLELNGMVEPIQGLGVYVKNTTSVEVVSMQNVEPQDIIRTRLLLEPEIAREAAKHISEEEKTALRDIIERFRIEKEARVDTMEIDKEFHRCVAKSSGNSLYYIIIDLILKSTEQELWNLIMSRTIATERYVEQNYHEHFLIAEAILKGDADEAGNIMKTHMERFLERYWS